MFHLDLSLTKNLIYCLILPLFFGCSISDFSKQYDTLLKSAGDMVYQIISKNFSDSCCIGIITEGSSDIVDFIPKNLIRYHIQIGGDKPSPVLNVEDNITFDFKTLNKQTQQFERFLVRSLNSGCPLYVIQVSVPKAVIRCFIRASRRAMYRLNRNFIFLPLIKPNRIIAVDEDIFLMKEMNCLPDLVVVRFAVATKEIGRNSSSPEYFTSNAEAIENDFCKTNRTYQDSKDKINYNIFDTIMSSPEDLDLTIEIRTHKFTGTNKNENILVDVFIPNKRSCPGVFLNSGNVFPDKIRNVEGRQLVIVAWYYPPFIIIDFNSKPPVFDGIEFKIIWEFMKYINGTFKVTTDPENYWGEAYENGTGDGVLGFIAMDKADIGLSAYYSWPKGYKVVDFGTPHMRSSVTMVTPRPKLKPGWLVPLMPFEGAMWGAVTASLLGSVCTLYVLQKFVDKVLGRPGDRPVPFSQLDYIVLHSFAMLVSQAPTFTWDSTIPRHVPARHFVGWFQFMGEVISDTYNAGLASVLSSPRYEPPIETINDLATRDIKWGANHISWIWSIQEDEHPDLQTITRNFRLLTEEQMIEIGRRSGDMAFGMERLQGGHFTTEPHINEATMVHRRIMKGTLYWSHLYMLLRKGSPYMRHFNILITRVREAGLPLYWEGAVIRRFMSERLQLQIATSRILHQEDEPAKINLDQLQGAFFLLMLGQLLGLVAFLVELRFRNAKITALEKLPKMKDTKLARVGQKLKLAN